MKITVEFNNLQEIEDFCKGVLIAPGAVQSARAELAERAQEPVKEAKARKSTPKKEEAKTEAAEAPAEHVEEPATEDKTAGHSEGDLKLLLSDKLKKGKKAEVKQLFEKYSVTCLTALLEAQKDNLDAVYAEAEVI